MSHFLFDFGPAFYFILLLVFILFLFPSFIFIFILGYFILFLLITLNKSKNKMHKVQIFFISTTPQLNQDSSCQLSHSKTINLIQFPIKVH